MTQLAVGFQRPHPIGDQPGHPYYALTTSAETRRRIDAILDRIWRGEAG